MTTLFPGALDDFTNPTSGTQLSATGIKHHQQHTDLNDAVEAIEAYVGKTNSTVTGSLTYQINNLTTIVGTGSSGGVTDAQFLTLTAHTGLSVERVYTLGAGLSGSDAGPGLAYTTRMYPTGVTSGTYFNPVVTVNAQGQITFASDSGDASGLVRGLPPAPRYVANFWFGDYVSTLDKVYFTTKVATGSIYYIDRTTDLPVLVATVSGKTPGAWVYSTFLTGFVMSNNALPTSGFVCTVTGGSLVSFVFGCDGGMCIRTTVSGKTMYGCGNASPGISIFDPATLTTTNTIATNAGGTDGRSIIFISGSDSVYSIRRGDGDITKIYCPTTGTATLSGLGGSLGSRCALTYNSGANRAFGCGDTQNKLVYFTPAAGSGTETCSTINFPPGASGSSGAFGVYSLGNFVYVSTNVSGPPYMLVLDAVNLTWKYPLQATESSSTIGFDRPSFMAGVKAENILYVGTSNSTSVGYYVFGRFS